MFEIVNVIFNRVCVISSQVMFIQYVVKCLVNYIHIVFFFKVQLSCVRYFIEIYPKSSSPLILNWQKI